MIKNKFKIILVIIISIIISSGISVYAAYNYFASDISYTRDGETMSVEEALNNLYEKNENLSSTLVKYKNYGTNGTNPYCDLEYTLEEDGLIVVNIGTRSISSIGLTTYFIKINGTTVASNSLSHWAYFNSWSQKMKAGEKITVHIDDQVSTGAAWAYINLIK